MTDTKLADSSTLVGNRLQGQVDDYVAAFTASVGFDQKLAKHDIAGSRAHAQMLHSQNLLNDNDYQAIREGLDRIESAIADGTFPWSVALEDVHMNVEKALTDDIGMAGKRLHTGRSRNDQIALDIRLYLREATDDINREIQRLQSGLISLAQDNLETIMPGFTHLQTAQPVSFAHHMMAYFEMFKRDHGRFTDCQKRMNENPLGAAALAGTPYDLDRQLTSELLGFDRPTANSLDSVSDRDFAIEFCAAASLLMMHLSRLAEELILWTSAQFAFITLPDRFCTGSSIMPQKKNPDVPELVRGKTGRVYGHLMSLLTLMKSQPLAYNKDNQEDKEPLFDSVDTVKNSLRAFADMIPHIEPNREKMREAALKGFATATDFADYLVGKGLPFRDAYKVVGNAVNMAESQNVDLAELDYELLTSLHDAIGEDVYEVLTLEASLAARRTYGGTAPVTVAHAIEDARAYLESLSS